jgi:hypothetical protein
VRRVDGIRVAVAVAVVGVCGGWFASTTAAAGRCPNEAFRTGRSAGLPDCRAYELVTPPELGRTADMTFDFNDDRATVSSDGEHLALQAEAAFLEPAVSLVGTRAVFSRTLSGWSIQSATTPAIAAERSDIELLSPDFSQIVLRYLRVAISPEETFAYGPVGGPYSTLNIPPAFEEGTQFLGANAGVPGVVPAFRNVLFVSTDHVLLPAGPEREAAEATEPGLPDLYEWSEGRLRLVNVNNEGKLLNPCGAELGSPDGALGEGAAINAVSADGSRVFFKSPARDGLPGCLGSPQLYMRVDGRQTVDVSEPEGVSVAPSQRGPVRYDGASTDGSRVYFTTATVLTPEAGRGYLLYEYDTEASVGHRLRLAADETENPEGHPVSNPGVVVSEDGSVVYYGGELEGVEGIYHYDAITGTKGFVADPSTPQLDFEPWDTTPDGGFLVFPAGKAGVQIAGPHGFHELVAEPRGLGHNELYRYDAADGSVMCVSCGDGVAPAKGRMLEPEGDNGLLVSPDSSRGPISVSEDGRVFFQTDARLVPQDTNQTSAEEEKELPLELGSGADVYEWDADGIEEAPGVFCGLVNGCTHLISAGEDVGPERFLGASANGDDLFFSSAAQLVSQATPEFSNIYDARVDGGFPSAAVPPECTSCQGVGSSPPVLGAPASRTFSGAENPSLPVVEEKEKRKKKRKSTKSKHKKGHSKGRHKSKTMLGRKR